VTNKFTRYFIIHLLRIDDKVRDAESVAEGLKAAVAGFIAGLPHFFEAAAVPEVLTAAPVALAASTPFYELNGCLSRIWDKKDKVD
jgi:hypothetical protein